MALALIKHNKNKTLNRSESVEIIDTETDNITANMCVCVYVCVLGNEKKKTMTEKQKINKCKSNCFPEGLWQEAKSAHA